MQLQRAQDLAIEQMVKYNLTTIRTVNGSLGKLSFYDGWMFEFNNAKSIFGQCDTTNKKIYLSKYLTSLRSEEEVMNTILHEIAHAIHPPVLVRKAKRFQYDQHHAAWRKFFISIGGTGERCSSLNVVVKAEVTYKYTVSCSCCGKSYGMHRIAAKKLINPPSCGTCCPKKFNKNYLMTIKQNY